MYQVVPDGSGAGNVRFIFNQRTYDAQTRIVDTAYGGTENRVTIWEGFTKVATYIENYRTIDIIEMFVASMC